MAAHRYPEHRKVDWEKKQSLMDTFPDKMDTAPPKAWLKSPLHEIVVCKDRMFVKMLLFEAPTLTIAPTALLLMPFDKTDEFNASKFFNVRQKASSK